MTIKRIYHIRCNDNPLCTYNNSKSKTIRKCEIRGFEEATKAAKKLKDSNWKNVEVIPGPCPIAVTLFGANN